MSNRRYRTWAHRLLASLLTILVFAAIAPSAAYSETRIVRVGQLRNPPLVFTDESGRPAGIFVDILQHVAAEQGWKLEWMPCIWSACLSRLVEGEIDLIGGIAYSEERARNFDFTLETVFNNWAVVLRASGSEIHSIADLEGLRVATPPRSIHSRALRHVLESFNIRSEVMEIGTTDMVRALQTGEVSAGIVNRLRASNLARRSGIEKTAIIFNPVELRFATAKGINADLRVSIDHAMSALKSDNSSAYYASLDKWLFAEGPQIAVPAWVWWVLSVTGGVLLMLFTFNQMLQARVKLSTASLRSAQAALLRKERLAALGQLTGTVAHEIRNPLGIIANSFRVIKHKCLEADLDMESTLERADRGIKRCDRIVTELLDFARARGLQSESTAINTWLSDILDEHHVPEGITVRLNLKADGISVDIDPEELRRAVINVIDNACQAMVDGNGENEPKAGSELTVASRLNGERAEIEFTDNGPGIPEDILPQVLEPLFSTKSFGTGLGLPTVQRIMEEHGGGLEINSEEGRGTRVTLWLPLGDGCEGVSEG